MLLLVTGATGKVGTNLIAHILSESRWRGAKIRALCHNRLIPETTRVEVIKGNISDRESVERSLALALTGTSSSGQQIPATSHRHLRT